MTTQHNKSNAESRSGLLRATSQVGGWTLVSRILGFLRDIILARLLGASPLADAFFVAFKLPNFFRRMFAEGTLTVALVPVLSSERQKSEGAAHQYLNSLATLLLLVLILFTLLGMIFMPWLLLLFAPGFHDEPDRWQQALLLARWMFPYLLLISLTAMAWGVLNTYKKFSLAAASPALLNLAIIFAALILAPGMSNPAMALALGVLLGGMLQLGIQVPALKRIGWHPRLSFRFNQPAVKETLKLFLPALLAIAAVQINLLVGTILATLLEAGAVSFLYYADRIVQLPLALFGIAMSTALLPELSHRLASGDRQAAHDSLDRGLAWLTWITFPAIVGLLWLAEPIIVTLFEHGRFDHASSVATASTLKAYAIGLIGFSWARLLTTACYADKDAKAPMRFATASVIANIALAVILMQFWDYVGLAMATSLAAFVNVALLYRHLKQKFGSPISRDSMHRIGRAILASLIMFLFLSLVEYLWPFPAEDLFWRGLWLALIISGSILVFAASAWALGERELLSRMVAVIRKDKP